MPDRASEPPPPPDAEGGGGTGCERMSPLRVLPQLLISRLTCDGGGATTAGAGKDSFAVDEMSRGGAETGGATTSVVCDNETRELARSRGASRGAGATTVGAIGLEARILSGEAFGAGAMGAAAKADVRWESWATSGAGAIGVAANDDEVRLTLATSGAGATTLVARLSWLRLPDEFTSGVGGTGLTTGSRGATSAEARPSAGGGPGIGLKASRFATAESL